LFVFKEACAVKLQKSTLNEIGGFIMDYARPLEQKLYKHHFQGPCSDEVICELGKFQNIDGGFGNAMESDFTLPYSSPMASSVAFQHLMVLDDNKKAAEMIKKGVEYFENTYVPIRKGWFAVPKEVNDYPHAPWWSYNAKEGMTAIDKYWGNPSAEIIGYLYRYRKFMTKLNVNELVEYAIEYLNNKEKFESFHEVYCFARFYKMISKELADKIKEKLIGAVDAVVCKDSIKWGKEYAALPLDLADSPELTFGISGRLIDENQDYYAGLLEEHKFIKPSWGKEFYKSGMEGSWDEWSGVLTLRALILLKRFGRIQGV
jgi:hypothetical protein